MTAVVVIGAGHAGLAVSGMLTERSVDHVVLERGRVAETWRTQRWDTLRLLTPNWQTRLPDLAYDGADPDGYMTMPEVVDFIERYARVVEAPVMDQTLVESVARSGDGYQVVTGDRIWQTEAVVLATGAFNLPRIPPEAQTLPGRVRSLSPVDYKTPDQFGEGKVLVVGASATGVQIADEALGAEHLVILAVGDHVRMPRTYRGRDVMWWMERTGRLDERYDQVDDIVRARRVPSPQLSGTPERRTIDLNALTGAGAELVGRLSGITDGRAYFSGSLHNKTRLADLKLARLLDLFDQWANSEGGGIDLEPSHRFEPTRVEERPRLGIDLTEEGVSAVVWATGYRPDYSWLNLPVFDRKGEIRHQGGVVTDAPGLYRIGSNFLRRRKSSFIHGAEDDAREITDHLVSHLNGLPPRSLEKVEV
ncbi:MAG TPA: NAD(P)-binding domain-containing protein [Acidimicrobiia bacterium]|nr:NAD(P)-binding domain-containing protein [Acidimicrobiia bacterium]